MLKLTVGAQMSRKNNIVNHYKTLLIMLIVCGFNYDLFPLKTKFKFVVKVYCIFLIITITIATVTCCDNQEVSQIWSLLEYVASTVAILILKNNVSKFFGKFKIIDTSLRIKNSYYYKRKIQNYLCCLFIWIVRIAYTAVFCMSYVCYNNFYMFLINQYSLLALDINRVWRLALYDEIRYRLKVLRLRLDEDPYSNDYLYVCNKKCVKENKMRFCLNLYRGIADAMDLMIPELHVSMFMSVICSVPKLVINVYHILLIIEDNLPRQYIGFMVMHILQISLFLFSPCVVAEMFSSEIELISKNLMHKLLEETDENVKSDIELFLRYTQMRNFRYKIWRMIPVNLSLPLELINLCTTYIIVVINFTHLYD